MPGLKNRTTWAPLLLKISDITSCANGCSLGITAHLTYINTEAEAVEGVFVYPLREKEVVVGFEAVVSGRLVSVELQSRGKRDVCCLDCCPGSPPHNHCGQSKEWGCCMGTGLEMQCSNGHLLLDEDLDRSTFIVGTGQIGPLEVVSVVISTTLELPTLENGAIRLVYPVALTPIVRGPIPPGKSESGIKSEENSPTMCFGSGSGKQERMLGVDQQCTHALLTSTATNLSPYQLSFQLLVRGACLLAGLESPTHALRADADPSAQSASSTYITLAEEHPCDRPLEIILHLSEPHSPLVILERGRLTFSEYEQQIRARRDFIRCARKEAEPEKKMEFLRRRYHKDLLLNPVLMLNFCPDLLSEATELQQASREIIFLIDNSSTMTQHNICKIKEGMLVAVKSLPARTLLNIAGICSHVKPLFSSSKACSDSTVTQALEYVQKMRVESAGANLLGALSWVYRQPVQRSCPRQLFILMDRTASDVGRVLELVRRNAWNVRCFGLGLGGQACRRLLQGIAKVTGGNTEFLSEDERLQPKLIKCLKKALEPALTDVRIDWYVPDSVEALLSPNEIPPLYPGNCLIGYCTLYDVSGFRGPRSQVKPRGSKGRSGGSEEALYELSPSTSEPRVPLVERERDTPQDCVMEEDFEEALKEISREISSEFSCAHATDGLSPGGDGDYSSSDVRWRILQESYVQDQYVLTRCSLSGERTFQTASAQAESSVLGMGSLPHGLEKMEDSQSRGLSRWESPWTQSAAPSSEADSAARKAGQFFERDEARRRQTALARSALAGRSFSSPQGELDMHRLRRALEKVSFQQSVGGRLAESDTDTPGSSQGGLSQPSLTDSNGLLFPASPLDWDTFTDPEGLFSAAPAEENQLPEAQCGAVIHGTFGGRDVSWEVSVDLSLLWGPDAPNALPSPDQSWDEIIHQLTARSVIRDFENVAEKDADPEVERGSSKRFKVKAIQTSKSCGVVCTYTGFTTTRNQPDVPHSGVWFGSRRRFQSDCRRKGSTSVGFGRRPSSRGSEETEDTHTSTERDDTPASPCSMTSCDSNAGGSVSPSAVSSRSQRSMESFFGSRFNLGRLKVNNAKQAPPKPQCLAAESETEAPDYLPLVRLQLASGAFLLSQTYSECIQIPLERLKRASPYLSHRRSLSPPFRCTSPPSTQSLRRTSPQMPAHHTIKHHPYEDPVTTCDFNREGSPKTVQADSGRGSETDMCEGPEAVDAQGEDLARMDVDSSSWAAAVALAWLEHRCAGFFVEWELVAAKADYWLKCQSLPEGLDLVGLRAAARQLFLLLRHWDENIQLNVLCYNPNNM